MSENYHDLQTLQSPNNNRNNNNTNNNNKTKNDNHKKTATETGKLSELTGNGADNSCNNLLQNN